MSKIFLGGGHRIFLLIYYLILMILRKLAEHSNAYSYFQHWGGRSSVISINSRSMCSRQQVSDPQGLHGETWSQQMGHL